MTRFLAGAFTVSMLLIGSYVYGPGLLEKLFRRGDTTVWPDTCKQAEYRQIGKAA